MTAAPDITPRERPILFSAPMVRAILSGAKSQTRRVVRIDNAPITEAAAKACRHQRGIPANAVNVRMCGSYVKCDAPPGSATVSSRVECPYGAPGDHLFVREMHTIVNGGCFYRADGPWPPAYGAEPKWKPSIFMPRRLSRITLVVESVRVERVQAISEDDAKAEGVETLTAFECDVADGSDARARFGGLWRKINGAESWDANPFVWVIGFRRAP
jgi:hypothetical protein